MITCLLGAANAAAAAAFKFAVFSTTGTALVSGAAVAEAVADSRNHARTTTEARADHATADTKPLARFEREAPAASLWCESMSP